jgi:uncharacterized protein (DUF1778 family)
MDKKFKLEKIEIRCTPEEKRLIKEAAAKVTGGNASKYLLGPGLKRAKRDTKEKADE